MPSRHKLHQLCVIPLTKASHTHPGSRAEVDSESLSEEFVVVLKYAHIFLVTSLARGGALWVFLLNLG